MKKIIFLTASIFSLSMLTAGNDPVSGDKYCAKIKDGKLTVMYQGYPLTSSITLNDGSIIKMDGSIIKKDGSTVLLREHKCVDKDGKIVNENGAKTMKRK